MAMRLGTFSVSLAVKDLAASRAYYEKLGFAVVGGDAEQDWLILRNEGAVIGLFHGLFEGHILAFTPGGDGDAQILDDFPDVRELQPQLEALGVDFASRADEGTTGPASFVVI